MSFPLFKCCKSNNFAGKNVAALIVAVTAGAGATIKFGDNWFHHGGGSSSLAGVSFLDSRSREKLVDLRGDWRFSIGDDMRWAGREFDDRTWSEISVPSYWESEGYAGYNGYAWYRRTFNFEAGGSARPLYLLLGQIDDADEVFVNGQRVGGTGQFEPEYATAHDLDRVYSLPDGLLEAGRENVVAVRVYDGVLGGGIKSGAIGIYSSDLPQPMVDLRGIWLLKRGDDPSWKDPEADETGFEVFKVPGTWDEVGLGSYDGYAWYRKSFQTASFPGNEAMVLLLGKIDDIDETFLNGTKIGKTGTDDDPNVSAANAWSQRRAYGFSSSLLKADNTLAVRVYDGQARGGIYDGPIGIMTKADHDLYWEMVESNRSRTFKTMIDWLLGRN